MKKIEKSTVLNPKKGKKVRVVEATETITFDNDNTQSKIIVSGGLSQGEAVASGIWQFA